MSFPEPREKYHQSTPVDFLSCLTITFNKTNLKKNWIPSMVYFN